MFDRKPFSGGRRRLVLALDLGTTFSGVSYAVLDPGKVPKIMAVTRYPGQEAGDAKIPTIIHYDKRGQVLAVGAEEPQVSEDDDEDWVEEPLKLEWFKLLLRPTSSALAAGIPSPKLPRSKTVVDVYADFYGYLFACARSFIQQTSPALGGLLWDSVENEIDFVLSHPNGWGGAQQSAMRRAAVQAGLVPDTRDGHARITFVSEGEASFQYCLSRESIVGEIEAESNVIVIDAGGGTVDISTYLLKSTSPIEVEEVAVPNCLFEGSVIVRQHAEAHIRAKLRNSIKFGGEGYVQAISQEFDKTAKKRFKGNSDASIKFSNLVSDRDLAFGIRNGTYKLTKDELCGFFDPAVNSILDAVRTQRRAISRANGNTPSLFLVGGFAASEYLYDRLKNQLSGDGLALYRPDSHTNKAVAEGAVSFYLDHFVTSRVARFTYGTECSTTYDESKASHSTRHYMTFIGVAGERLLRRYFQPILHKGTQVSEIKEFRQTVHFNRKGSLENTTVTSDILTHNEKIDFPDFLDGSFSHLLQISGFLNDVPSTLRPRVNGGGHYYRQDVDVVISFGLTELKAELAWMREGVEIRSPAKIIYDDDFAVTVSDS